MESSFIKLWKAQFTEAEEIKKKMKRPCCVCKSTKKLRDFCIRNNDEEQCLDFIEANNKCLRAKGFRV